MPKLIKNQQTAKHGSQRLADAVELSIGHLSDKYYFLSLTIIKLNAYIGQGNI